MSPARPKALTVAWWMAGGLISGPDEFDEHDQSRLRELRPKVHGYICATRETTAFYLPWTRSRARRTLPQTAKIRRGYQFVYPAAAAQPGLHLRRWLRGRPQQSRRLLQPGSGAVWPGPTPRANSMVICTAPGAPPQRPDDRGGSWRRSGQSPGTSPCFCSVDQNGLDSSFFLRSASTRTPTSIALLASLRPARPFPDRA